MGTQIMDMMCEGHIHCDIWLSAITGSSSLSILTFYAFPSCLLQVLIILLKLECEGLAVA